MPTPATPPSQSHRERLTVPVGWWLLALGFALTLVVAVAAYLNLWFGAATALLSLLVIGVFLISYGHTVVRADASGLQVGRSHIDWRWISGVEALDKRQARDAMGPGALASGWFFTRPYADGAVRFTLDDPADPHPFWFVSSRHPQKLAAVAAQYVGQGEEAQS